MCNTTVFGRTFRFRVWQHELEVARPQVVLHNSMEPLGIDGTSGRLVARTHARSKFVHVTVDDIGQLQILERQCRRRWNGEVLYNRDKRAPDLNGDREIMECQGINPHVRGAFPLRLRSGGSMQINPAGA